MGKKTDYIECGLVRPEAVAEGVRESNGCAMRTVRCVNLRPAPGADGRPVLQGVGRPPSLGVMPYNNRTLCRLRVSDCANKFMGLKF